MASPPSSTVFEAAVLKAPIEILPGRLYLSFLPASSAPAPPPSPSAPRLFIGIEDDLTYEQFYADFGPVNLAKVVRFCRRLHAAVTTPLPAPRSAASSPTPPATITTKAHAPPAAPSGAGGPGVRPMGVGEKGVASVVYCWAPDHAHRRTNAALLVAAYTLLFHGRTAMEAYAPFLALDPPLSGFRDAAFDLCSYRLSVFDCLAGMEKAMLLGHFNIDSFNLEEYEHVDKIENGDMNWIVPHKFLAFSGPLSKRREVQGGKATLLPEECATLFKRMGVGAVIRFNEKCYDRKKFTEVGIRHHELWYEDGANPPDAILTKFLQICEAEPGPIAVHCKAGLGRTGTNIAAYMIKNYRYTAREAMAWCRICRPGSIVAQQQAFVHALEPRYLWQKDRSAVTPNGRRSSRRSSDLGISCSLGGTGKWEHTRGLSSTMLLDDAGGSSPAVLDKGEPRVVASNGHLFRTGSAGATHSRTSSRGSATTSGFVGLTREKLAAAGVTPARAATPESKPTHQHRPSMTDQRGVVSRGYDMTEDAEDRMPEGQGVSIRLDGELVGIHAMALQARNRQTTQGRPPSSGGVSGGVSGGASGKAATGARLRPGSRSQRLIPTASGSGQEHARRPSRGGAGGMILTRSGTLIDREDAENLGASGRARHGGRRR